VALCTDCGLSQLTHVVSPEVLYRHDYPYEASTTATGRKHFDQFAEQAWKDAAIFPVIPEAGLRATLGILARTVE